MALLNAPHKGDTHELRVRGISQSVSRTQFVSQPDFVFGALFGM